MITDDLKNKTMSAVEWISLLNLNLHVCHCCGGFSPTVTDIALDNDRWYTVEYRINPEFIMSFPATDVQKVCFDCEQRAQKRKSEWEVAWAEKQKREAVGIFYDYSNEWHDCRTRPTTINKTGSVYVCKVLGRESVYKIGATIGINGVKGRINAQKDLSLDGFVCSLETKDPFGLEKFLHNRFYKSRARNANTTEWFEIDHQGIAFIKAMRQYNGKDITVKEVIT
jgi:hypothetical protein